jgi:sarcosine oxidase subunit delta
MFLIYCPYCEEHREEDEFHSAGQAHRPRPKDPDGMSDEQWADYLYFRKNPRGEHRELWVHSAGCGKYFNIARNTQTYEIYATYKIGTQLTIGIGSEDPDAAGVSGTYKDKKDSLSGSDGGSQ